MKLVIFSKDWADEFNCDGFCVFTDECWQEYKTVVESSKSFNMNFGSNEGWEEEEPSDVLQYDLTVKDITEAEAAVVEKLFGTNYGIFPDLECFLDENGY